MTTSKNIQFKIELFLLLVLLTTFQPSCQKLVEVEGPSTSTNEELVYGTDADATAAVIDMFIKFIQSAITRNGNLMSAALFTGLSADELKIFPGIIDQGYQLHYDNNLSALSSAIANYWSGSYNTIFAANAAMEKLNENAKLTPAVKQQLLGYAKLARAFCYFYLINTYGDVPLNLSTDYQLNTKRERTDKSIVYKQIIEDLKDAQSKLSAEYKLANLSNTAERVLPNSLAATALLARVYLYVEDYENAEAEATKVISSTSLYELVDIDEVFLKNSRETIWSLQPVNGTWQTNTSDALFFLPGTNSQFPLTVYMEPDLISRIDESDQRKLYWIDSLVASPSVYYYSKKYRNNIPSSPVTEYPVVLRLAEQYLIRAEARARKGTLTGSNSAETDLNAIRSRAGLNPTTAGASQLTMLSAILDERRVELFLEWGHRWFDLKRTGKANEVLGVLKGSNWQTEDQLYPIPQEEIDKNPAIRNHQNPQY